jgi:hypothetical protein
MKAITMRWGDRKGRKHMNKAWTMSKLNVRQLHSKRWELRDPDGDRVAVITIKANYAVESHISAALNLTTQIQRQDWITEQRFGKEKKSKEKFAGVVDGPQSPEPADSIDPGQR